MLSLYFWRSTISAAKRRALTLVKTCTLIGILIMLQKNTLVCTYWSMCGKYGEYGKHKRFHNSYSRKNNKFKAVITCMENKNKESKHFYIYEPNYEETYLMANVNSFFWELTLFWQGFIIQGSKQKSRMLSPFDTRITRNVVSCLPALCHKTEVNLWRSSLSFLVNKSLTWCKCYKVNEP